MGLFLLYAGPLDRYISQRATVLVGSIGAVLETLSKAGEFPNGTRVLVRHPDGSVFEYMQPRA